MKGMPELSAVPSVLEHRADLPGSRCRRPSSLPFRKRALTYCRALLILLAFTLGVANPLSLLEPLDNPRNHPQPDQHFPAAVLRGGASPQSALSSDASNGAQSPKRQLPENFLIRHVRVFDGERAISSTAVLVQNGRIVAVGPRLRPPKGFRILEGRGHTLLPGLIDAHTHIHARQDLEQSLAFGVTTDLSMLMDLRLATELKAEQQTEEASNRADLFSSGYCATAPGGHGTEYGLKFPTLTGPREAQAWVDDRIAEGADYIKIIYENGGDTGHGGRPSIDKATLQALIEAAQLRKKLAIVHIHSEQQAIEAIASGADGLAHLFAYGGDQVDPEFAPLVSAHHAFVIPTFSVLESVCNLSPGQRILDDPKLGPFLLPAYLPQLRKNINHGQANHCMFSMTAVPPLSAAHVPILAGTDAGNPGTAPGASLHGELAYLVEAGLTPSQALAAATSAAATAFRLEDRGRIAPGLRADLLLVDGDPTADIKATRDILAIWKSGVLLDRQAWLRRVKTAADGRAASGPHELPERARERRFAQAKARTKGVMPRSMNIFPAALE